MAYDESLAEKLRIRIGSMPGIEEKKMFGGLVFMLNDKMCIGVVKDEVMVRLDPDLQESILKKPGVRPMDPEGITMKGFIFVEMSALKSSGDLDFWISKAIDYNPKAQSKKRK